MSPSFSTIYICNLRHNLFEIVFLIYNLKIIVFSSLLNSYNNQVKLKKQILEYMRTFIVSNHLSLQFPDLK